MRACAMIAFGLLAGCASGMTPISDPVLQQSFTIESSSTSVYCEGTYTREPNSVSVDAPIFCHDGRTGEARIATGANGHPITANVVLSDGSQASTDFSPILADRHAYARSAHLPRASSPTRLPSAASASSPSRPSPPRVYSGNCPTPDSLDSAGRRCGARSAASRAGGDDGYGSWSRTPSRISSGGTISVRGHFRNGRWVRPHTRRRR